MSVFHARNELIEGENMTNLIVAIAGNRFLLSIAAIVLFATTAAAQGASDKCRPAGVIPLASEAPAKIFVDPPLP